MIAALDWRAVLQMVFLQLLSNGCRRMKLDTFWRAVTMQAGRVLARHVLTMPALNSKMFGSGSSFAVISDACWWTDLCRWIMMVTVCPCDVGAGIFSGQKLDCFSIRCVELACSPGTQLPCTVQKHELRLIWDSELPLGVKGELETCPPPDPSITRGCKAWTIMDGWDISH